MKRLVLLFLALAVTPTPAAHAADPPRFHVGVYVYEYQLAAAAAGEAREYAAFVEEHLRILRDHGVNAIYLGGTSRERFDEHLRLAEQYGMKLIPQLDFAYFQPTWTDEQADVYAKAAGEFIHRHRDDPRVLAWSVREEVPQAAVGALARYYEKIREHAPAARFNKVHNSFEAARDQPAPHPAIYGTDRYAFWFEVSGGGYLASPSFALDWTRREAARYADEAARRGADFMLVVTQGGMLMPHWANQIVSDPHAAGVPGDAGEREHVRRRVLCFAEQGRMGWRTVPGPDGEARYNFWKYYRLPPNCMKALAWTSVLEGAKLFFVWSYAPPTRDDLRLTIDIAATQPSPRHEFNWVTLAGRPGLPNPQLAELADAAKEIRACEGVIARMNKVAEPAIACDQVGIHHRTFALAGAGVAGRVVVVHNANVGRWPAESRHFFNEGDDVRVDDEGNLVGYVPLRDPREVRFTLPERGDAPNKPKVFDARTGAPIRPDDAGGYRASVGPGSAAVLYIGSDVDARVVSGWADP